MNKVLLVTVTKTETQAVLEAFLHSPDTALTRRVIKGKIYYPLGQIGGVEAFLVQSEMGTGTPGGALLTVWNAIEALSPQAVIMVGIAFGTNPEKQKLGDILVSQKIVFYEPQKVKGRTPIQRGDRVTASTHLLDKFRSGDLDWHGARVHFGLILSGEKLINSTIFRNRLLKLEPEAIGGEMEGAGLYAASESAKVNWILIKGICDWADGNKKDKYQKVAAKNASRFVRHVIQESGLNTGEDEKVVLGTEALPDRSPASILTQIGAQLGEHNSVGHDVTGHDKNTAGRDNIQQTASVINNYYNPNPIESTNSPLPIHIAQVPPQILHDLVSTNEWNERVEQGFKPIPLAKRDAIGLYGHPEALTGKHLLGNEHIPFILDRHESGKGHRILELHPQHARDQVAKDIKPADFDNVAEIYVLLSGGDTRWIRDRQNFQEKPIGEIRIHFSDDTYTSVPLRLGAEIREWVSGDMNWDVVTTASEAESVWHSSDNHYSFDMIRIEIADGPKNIKELVVIAECKWLPDDYQEPLPSIRISGVTFQFGPKGDKALKKEMAKLNVGKLEKETTNTDGQVPKKPDESKSATLFGLTHGQTNEPINPNSNSVVKASEVRLYGTDPIQTLAHTPASLIIHLPFHLELIRVPAGEFLMGSNMEKDKEAGGWEWPQHSVYVSEFYLSRYPITNAQYAEFKKRKIPSNLKNRPVGNVSWHDAQNFCQWLTEKTRKNFRLPTEAEWEKAARGTDGRVYPWGDEWDNSKLNSKESGIGEATPVGKYSPNNDSPYGLADMSGNVWEWCLDWYQDKEYQQRVGKNVRDPKGPLTGSDRVVRGGSWVNSGKSLARVAARFGNNPKDTWDDSGFRVGLVLTPATLLIDSPIHLELIRIPAGEFLMGSDKAKDPDADNNEMPQHHVYLSEFYISKYPITRAQYTVFKKIAMSSRPEYPAGDVSWNDAYNFCQWLSEKTGKIFRLPTEAEWEKAARGIDGRIFPWGNEWHKTKLNSQEGGLRTNTSVGEYSPVGDSPYGLADMSGNVWEWCADWFDAKEYQVRAGKSVRDPQGPDSGTQRVLRGGSWQNDRAGCRTAVRLMTEPNFTDYSVGFRIALSL